MGRPKGSTTSKSKSGDLKDWIDLLSAMSDVDRAITIATMTGVHEALCRVEKKQPAVVLPKARQEAFKDLGRDAAQDLLENNAAVKEGL